MLCISKLRIWFKIIFSLFNNKELQVARWPHGCRRQCSEVAVPAIVGSNLTEGGRFFPRKEPPPGHIRKKRGKNKPTARYLIGQEK
jgi:hypothetical protein